MIKRLLLACASILLITAGYGNAISVSNLVVDAPNQEVSFDLAWNNSWRLDGVGAPNNWDAAWVFVKFAPCDSTAVTQYTDWFHGEVSTNVGDHSFGNLEPVLNDGTIGIADNLGVMLRRNATGLFTNEAPTNITLNVTNLNPSETYHLRVVAIEMVYVNEEAFDLGYVANYNSFDSLHITSEAALTITSAAGGANGSNDMAASFPKGYAAFHCMKYEISHGQYATFLNTLNITQSTNRFNGTTANRHAMTNAGGNQFESYVSDREDRAYNYMTWNDLLSYLDWAGLTPMTELQYEKACRGPLPAIVDEYAWGSTYINNDDLFTGAENGTEYLSDATATANNNNVLFQNGDGNRGPVRCGIFALPSNTTREQSGATYYGIMEMTGNLWELCVNVSSFTDLTGTVAFDGSYGDGYVDANGLYDVANWPLPNAGSGIRGGGCTTNNLHSRLSARFYFLYDGNAHQSYGGRGIR